jgi:signal transduction histidine kinase
MLRKSLVARLVALASIWAAVLLGAGAFGLTNLYRTTVFRDADDALGGVIRSLLETIEISNGRVVVGVAPGLDRRYAQTYSGRYWQVFRVEAGEGGLTSIAESRSLWDESLAVDADLLRRAAARPGQREAGVGDGPEGQKLRILVSIVRVGPDGESVLIAAALDRGALDRDVSAFALAASWTLAAFAVAMVAGVLIQVRLGLAPVFAMREEVADVRAGARERLDEAAPSELAPLARELNALIDHNRDVVERARAQVGNLAHALKTPISVILNEARSQEGAFAETVRVQTEKMRLQVEHHLRRASAAARAQSVGSRAGVRAVADDLARTLPRMYPERAIELEVDVPEDLAFRGERQDLEEMIGNLLDNAFKWARARVRIAARPTEEPSRLFIHVDDDGDGLAEAQRSEVVARGARLDEAAPGSGLGLAIVQDLARAYAGHLNLGVSPLGGLRATVDLPASAPRRVTTR